MNRRVAKKVLKAAAYGQSHHRQSTLQKAMRLAKMPPVTLAYIEAAARITMPIFRRLNWLPIIYESRNIIFTGSA